MTFSEVVNELQGDEVKAAHLLVVCADEQQKTLKEIAEAEKALQKAKSDYEGTKATIGNIRKHLKLDNGVTITQERNIYKFNKHNEASISDIDFIL